MAKYALLSDTYVVNVVVSDTEDQIGVFASIYEVVDITNIDPQPGTGWTRESGVWYPPNLSPEAKLIWTNQGFVGEVEEIIEAELIEEESSEASSKKGK
jgi:hypothetical protein